MKSFLKRTLSAVVFVGLMLGGILAHQYTYVVLFAGIMVIGLLEYFKTLKNKNIKPATIYGVFVSLCCYTLSFLYQIEIVGAKFFFLIVPLLFAVFIIEIFNKSKYQDSAYTITGIIYVSFPFSLLHFITFKEPGCDYSSSILLGVILTVWAYDTAAFLVGSLIGKHKLFEKLSPAKTWEGFIGGLVLTVGISYFISLIFNDLEWMHWMIISVIIVVFGTLGDLTESMFKRSMGVKDTGSIIPGHGGILDRFDAFMMSVPMVFLYLKLFV